MDNLSSLSISGPFPSLPTSQTMVDAYSLALCHKVMSASGKQKNRKFDQEAFRKGVSGFCETLKVSRSGVMSSKDGFQPNR